MLHMTTRWRAERAAGPEVRAGVALTCGGAAWAFGPAGGSPRGRRRTMAHQLVLHLGLFNVDAGFAHQDDAVQHLQGHHSASGRKSHDRRQSAKPFYHLKQGSGQSGSGPAGPVRNTVCGFPCSHNCGALI